jgi:hypothetical protein
MGGSYRFLADSRNVVRLARLNPGSNDEDVIFGTGNSSTHLGPIVQEVPPRYVVCWLCAHFLGKDMR